MQKIILTAMALSLWLHATPQTLNNMELITNLEKFTPICKYYSGAIKNPHKIKMLCSQYDKKLNDVLRLGNRVDKYVVPTTHTHMYLGKEHTCTAQTLKTTKYDNKVLNRYRLDVFSLDKLRGEIVEYARSEKARARRQYDVEYHEKLTAGGYYSDGADDRKYEIKLYDDDITFMCEHKEVYIDAENYQFINKKNGVRKKCKNSAQKQEKKEL